MKLSLTNLPRSKNQQSEAPMEKTIVARVGWLI